MGSHALPIDGASVTAGVGEGMLVGAAEADWGAAVGVEPGSTVGVAVGATVQDAAMIETARIRTIRADEAKLNLSDAGASSA